MDADCLVAGTLTRQGATTRLLDLWQQGAFELVVCPQLLHEVGKTLRAPRVAGRYEIDLADVDTFVGRLRDEGVMFEDPPSPRRFVPADQNDDYLVELVLSADAEYLVTRDAHFEDVDVEGVTIITPGRFVRALSGLDGTPGS